MQKYHRNLLVLLSKNPAKYSVDNTAEMLDDVLISVEKIEKIITAHEVINMNRYKIFSDKKIVRKVILADKIKPFVFLFNKN